MRIVGYYPNWTHYRTGDGKYTVDDIQPSLCTHIIYSFVVLDPKTHLIKIHDDWLDVQLGNIKKFTRLKTSHPGVKFLVALGGWTDSRTPGNRSSLCLLFFLQTFRSVLHPSLLSNKTSCLRQRRRLFPVSLGFRRS